MHTRNQHLRNHRGFAVALSDEFSMAFSNGFSHPVVYLLEVSNGSPAAFSNRTSLLRSPACNLLPRLSWAASRTPAARPPVLTPAGSGVIHIYIYVYMCNYIYGRARRRSARPGPAAASFSARMLRTRPGNGCFTALRNFHPPTPGCRPLPRVFSDVPPTKGIWGLSFWVVLPCSTNSPLESKSLARGWALTVKVLSGETGRSYKAYSVATNTNWRPFRGRSTDSFQNGSGQTGSSRKRRNLPWSTFAAACGNTWRRAWCLRQHVWYLRRKVRTN